MDKNEEILEQTVRYFKEKQDRYGATVKGLDWNSKEAQNIRMEMGSSYPGAVTRMKRKGTDRNRQQTAEIRKLKMGNNRRKQQRKRQPHPNLTGRKKARRKARARTKSRNRMPYLPMALKKKPLIWLQQTAGKMTFMQQ